MLKFALSLLVSVLANVAFAAPVCPAFPYDLNEEEGVRELRSFGIDEETELTALQATQVLQVAQWMAKNNDEAAPKTTAAAVKYLAEGSEGGDISYLVFKFENVIYVQVVSYPGGNSYGLVFKGSTAIAERTDGDVTCL